MNVYVVRLFGDGSNVQNIEDPAGSDRAAVCVGSIDSLETADIDETLAVPVIQKAIAARDALRALGQTGLYAVVIDK